LVSLSGSDLTSPARVPVFQIIKDNPAAIQRQKRFNCFLSPLKNFPLNFKSRLSLAQVFHAHVFLNFSQFVEETKKTMEVTL
jgi:hypothetical protein